MTIFILPARLKLLHFQKLQLPLVAHALIKACLLSDTTDPSYFFSYTENSYEISIVASVECIEKDFLPLLSSDSFAGVQVSQDVYRVLQVDDEGGQDCSGKRISDLSAPLAQAQFSIFYMSTYQTDFVLIKEIKLAEAVASLIRHGFDFDQESVDEELGSLDIAHVEALNMSNLVQKTDEMQLHADLSQSWEQTVLDNELRCVGLNKHADAASWCMSILKILLYPDMIEGYRDTKTPRFFSYTSTCEGVSLMTDQYILDTFDENIICGTDDESPLRVIQVNLSDSNLDRCGIVRSISHPLSTEAQINILYLSTYTTANIIVSAGDLEQAKTIMTSRPQLDIPGPTKEEKPLSALSDPIET
ncbi:hypothetical protein INT44_002840 [Umbelopsis vinacea]|uniref:CASTOR ACT domain-containing protein n=1 Tax=Umbelopsis vinacea TaxID=44442 RepID=A0A8H7Q8B2_9FUNG|nr:hypothetical protein INT44_002840 [Umbelopsis vinacea]